MSKSHIQFRADMDKFKQMGGIITGIRPHLDDNQPFYMVDAQYNMMNRWALRKIIDSGVKDHVDIGSQLSFVFMLSGMTHVTFLDLRQPNYIGGNITYIEGDLKHLPYGDNTINSLSCLHVAEHIGLGRYGDDIDPLGFSASCKEMSRILAVGGTLYFAVPCGKPQVEFNSYRVLSYRQIIHEFKDLRLVSHAAMNKIGNYQDPASDQFLIDDEYGVGMFEFRKEE